MKSIQRSKIHVSNLEVNYAKSLNQNYLSNYLLKFGPSFMGQSEDT
jgi:hypothetical protein